MGYYILYNLEPTLSTFGLPNCKPKNGNDGSLKSTDLSPLVTTILNMARVLELLSVLVVYGLKNANKIHNQF
jgi:hypothetical protein